MKHQKYFENNGLGTENVAPFLYDLCRMVRPQRVLEIGIGYTTPFFIDALNDNYRILYDVNIDDNYLQKDYSPKFVCIDNCEYNITKVLDLCKKYDFVDVFNFDFQGKSKFLKEKYDNFDFVWFDCGSVKEYEDFVKEYWDLCSEYVIFHYTYHRNRPNKLLKSILENIKGSYDRLDIIEPHKFRQGSITIIKKHKEHKKIKNIIYN